MRRGVVIAGLLLASLAFDVWALRYVWLSGFDQGAAVAMCVSVSIEHHEGLLAVKEQSCIDAENYRKTNPLWSLRRREGEE